MSIGQDLLNVPMGEMILQMALAIAEAQFELDKSSIMVAEMMGGQQLLRDTEGRLVDYDGTVMENQRDAAGNPIYDDRGRVVYEDGHGPRVIDSRVYFGYTYEPMLDANGQAQVWPNGATKMVRKPNLVSMLELGFTPTFYQFVDSICEVKIGIKTTTTTEDIDTESSSNTTQTTQDLVQTVKASSRRSFSYRSAKWGKASFASARARENTRYKQIKTGQTTNVSVQNVDAQYSSKYSYSAEGASLLRTKIVPIPPPAILEERIRKVMEAEEEYLKLAAQGLHGVAERVGDDGEEIGRPTAAIAKVERVVGDQQLIDDTGKFYRPDGRTIATTARFTSQASAAYTFDVPTTVSEGKFTIAVAAGAGTVSVKQGTATPTTIAAGASKVVTISASGLNFA